MRMSNLLSIRTSSLASIIFFALLPFSTTQAQTPSKAQIEQFKRMSPTEQKALAGSLGIDISDYSGLLGGNNAPTEVTSAAISGPRAAKAEIVPGLEVSPDAKVEKEKDAGVKAFGYDLFHLGADAFTPATNIPIPADYTLGPGDTLIIQLYGKESTTYNLAINRDGNIQFPEIGPLTLAGLNYARASEKIAEVVSEQMIGIKSSVTMGQLRTIRIFVLGEVAVPGSYVVGSLSTMTNALFASGGVSDIGSLRKIQLKRAGKIITSLDLYDLLLKGDTSNDARLLPGDVIFVPPVGKTAAVSGAVKRPAIYELINKTSAGTLLTLAGGLSPTAHIPSSNIERIAKTGEKTLVEIDLSSSKGKQFQINDADVLHIASTLNHLNGVISITGHVKRTEKYAWKPKLHFSDIIKSTNDLLPFPDTNVALIQRESPKTKQVNVLIFSPKYAFEQPHSEHDPILHAKDIVHMFGYEDMRSEILASVVDRLKIQANFNQRQKTVHIQGSIRFPGTYPMTENMVAKDLVLLAGGFTESSLGRDAEITRYDLTANRERVALHIQTDLLTENPTLLEGDSLRIQQIPLWTEKENIDILGEVIHPGTYTILPGETLLDILERAGGLTAQAYPHGAIFSRADLRTLEAQRLDELRTEIESDLAASLLESSNTRKQVNDSQAAKILNNIDTVRPLGRMVINLPKIIQHPNELDFQLIDGDNINIPRYKPSITVVGEVQYPTSHFFDKSLSVKDYLERSGGLKRNADKSRVYVVKANGEVFQPRNTGWFGGRSKKLSPGDTVIVPLDTKRVDKLTLWSSVTSIMSNFALGLAAIRSL